MEPAQPSHSRRYQTLGMVQSQVTRDPREAGSCAGPPRRGPAPPAGWTRGPVAFRPRLFSPLSQPSSLPGGFPHGMSLPSRSGRGCAVAQPRCRIEDPRILTAGRDPGRGGGVRGTCHLVVFFARFFQILCTFISGASLTYQTYHSGVDTYDDRPVFLFPSDGPARTPRVRRRGAFRARTPDRELRRGFDLTR